MLVESLLIPGRMKHPKNYADAKIVMLEKKRGKIVEKVIVKGSIADIRAIYILCEQYPLDTPLELVMSNITRGAPIKGMFQTLIDSGCKTVRNLLGDNGWRHRRQSGTGKEAEEDNQHTSHAEIRYNAHLESRRRRTNNH